MAWPCLPRFRIPETPCSPRLRLVVSRSWLVQSPFLLPDVGSALPDFDTCLDSLQYSSCGIGSGIKPQWGVLSFLVSVFPSLPHCLRFHWLVVSNDEELGVRQVPSPSHTGTSVSALRPCNPLARSLHSCLRFHRTVVPMDDVRCGLRLFLSSCRCPSGRWKPLHVAYPIFPVCAHHWVA